MDIKNYRYRLPKELQEGCELFLAPLPGYNQDPGLSIWPDISGHNRHGEIHGATWELGKWGWELRFDGIDDHVVCPVATTVTDNLTLFLHSKSDSYINGAIGIKLGIESGGVGFGPQNTTNKGIIGAVEWLSGVGLVPNVPVGIYQSQVLRRLTGDWQFNISNKMSSVKSSADMLNPASIVTTIGCRYINSILNAEGWFDGNIPFAAIWSRALTEEQIKILNAWIEGTKLLEPRETSPS